MTCMQCVTIIIVEDDEGHARLIEKNLRRAAVNNQIARCKDGATALETFRSDVVAGQVLILLDLNLPDMSGIDLLRYLKSDPRTHKAPVIILTTTDDKIEIDRCYDLGCSVYITKPVDYEQFANAIQRLGLFISVVKIPEAT